MFVTDSREVTKNPFHVHLPQYCPDYAIIIMPKDDLTNEFIRDLENVAHDEVQPNSIEDPGQQRQIKQAFRNGRVQLIELVNTRIERNAVDGNRNLHHLAAIVGDENEGATGETGQARKLATRTRKQNFQTASALAVTETSNPDSPPPTPPGSSRSGSSGTPTGPKDPPGAPNPPRPKASPIGRVRLVAVGPHDAAVMFSTSKPGQTIRLRLTPSGEMVSNEEALQITGASEHQSASVVVDDDTIEIQAQQARRYCLRVNLTDDISKTALSVRNIA